LKFKLIKIVIEYSIERLENKIALNNKQSKENEFNIVSNKTFF